jgi:PAS domain S-box-containing protein
VSSSESRFRLLVESSPDAILIVRDGRIVFANPAAARLVSVASAEQLLDASPYDFIHPEHHPLIRERAARLRAGAQMPPAEAKIIRLDGVIIDVEVHSTKIADVDGDAVQVVVRDVTERKHKEAVLRENEERLTLAFAGAQEGVWDWNLETDAVHYSPRWKQMLGYSEEEIEPHVSAWERLVHPDDRAIADRANENVTRGNRTYEAEFRLRHKNGDYIHVLSRGFPIRSEPGGPVVRIVGTHLDITDRKRTEMALRDSEERLTLAFEGAQEGVWDWNLETGAVLYSPRWKQMLGYTEDEIEPHVSAWEHLLHPDDLPEAQRLNERVMRGERTYEGEFRLRHKDGHYVHVLSRGFPVRRDPDGPVVRIVGTHFDLTERQRAEGERSRTELLARLVFAQEDERRRIAREMHDQFGEQLTALEHRIAALRKACGDRHELRELVEAVDVVAKRLDRDVDQLVWELRPTALDDLGLRAALANYVQDWSQRVGVSAELHTAGLLDERLDTEAETTLYRIAQEALTNVARHAHAGSVDVILERRGDSVMLIVEDDGVGFEAGAHRRGHGFGLIGMQERAALVGATLEIESAAGKGTTILVRMAAPARQAADRA